MGFFSAWQRAGAASGRGREPRAQRPQRLSEVEPAEVLRKRARRRLIGSAVLVAVAVVVLPLVFESKPRPVNPAIAISVPRQDGAPAVASVDPVAVASPSVMAPGVRAASAAGVSAAEPVNPAAPGSAGLREPAPDAPRSATPAVAAAVKPSDAAASQAALAQAAERAAVARLAKDKADRAAADKAAAAQKQAADRLAAEKAAAQKAAADKLASERAAAAKAAMAQKADAAGRFVVQVGAFAEAAMARDARQRIEKLGLKASEQEVDTPNGKRIRVRLGPYSSRDDADKALARVHAAGLPGAVLGL